MGKLICMLFLSMAFSQLALAQTGAGCNGLEKEMAEIVYMSKEELRFEFCWVKEKGDIYKNGRNTDTATECRDYQRKLLRVLKKDHGIDKVQCPESMLDML